MLRNEIEKTVGLTRKALAYYEEKGLIAPPRMENGYRNYSQEDMEKLKKIAIYAKLGMHVEEMKACLDSNQTAISSILRHHQEKRKLDTKRTAILEMLVNGEEDSIIEEKLDSLEVETVMYDRLITAFPGYIGQMLFSACQPFFTEPVKKNSEQDFQSLIRYLDALPPFPLTKEEENYLDEVTAPFDMDTLQELNEKKIGAVENFDTWLQENQEAISAYNAYKNSDVYLQSPLKQIYDRLQTYLIDNQFYDNVTPLLSRISPSYNDYYQKLLVADEKYIQNN